MKQYDITSVNYRNFRLSSDGLPLAELSYPQWYSFKATITLSDGSSLSLQPKGFWDAKIELKKEEDVLMQFKLGWKGILISVNTGGGSTEYLLKHRGLLNSRYVLIDTDAKELLAVRSDFNWSKFKLDYSVETSDAFAQLPMQEALLLLIIHAINYQMNAMAGAV